MWRGKAYLTRANPRAATHGSVAASGFAMAKNTCDGEARGMVAGCLGMCPTAACVSIVCVRCRSGCTLWICPTPLTQLLHASTPSGRPLVLFSSSSSLLLYSSASTFFHSHPSILSLSLSLSLFFLLVPIVLRFFMVASCAC